MAEAAAAETNTDKIILQLFGQVSGVGRAQFVRLDVISSFLKVKPTVASIWKSQKHSRSLDFNDFLTDTLSRHPGLFPMLKISLNDKIYVPVRSRVQVQNYVHQLSLGETKTVCPLSDDLSYLVLYIHENTVNLLRAFHKVIAEISQETGKTWIELSALSNHTSLRHNFEDLQLKALYGWSPVKNFIIGHTYLFNFTRINGVNHVSLKPGVNLDKYIYQVKIPEARPLRNKTVQRVCLADKTNVAAQPEPSSSANIKQSISLQRSQGDSTQPRPVTRSLEPITPDVRRPIAMVKSPQTSPSRGFEALLEQEMECLFFFRDKVFINPIRRVQFSKMWNAVKFNGNFRVKSYLTEDKLKKFVLRHHKVFPIILLDGREFIHSMVEETDFHLYINRDLPSKVQSLAKDLDYWKTSGTSPLKDTEIGQDEKGYNVDLKCLLFLRDHVFVVPDRPVSFINVRSLMNEFASDDINERLAMRKFDHFMMVEHNRVFPRIFTDDSDLVSIMVSEEDFDKYLRRLS